MKSSQIGPAVSRIKQLSEAQVDALIARIESAIAASYELADDLIILLDVLKSWLHMQERLAKNDLTIQKLRKLLGIVAASEARRRLNPKPTPLG